MTRQEQGDLGEISAAEWFVTNGVCIALPFGHNPDWDLLAELDGRLVRVQVKTSSFQRKGRWEVAVCTRGGNQSWTGVVKRLSLIHISEPTRQKLISYAVFCLKKFFFNDTATTEIYT